MRLRRTVIFPRGLSDRIKQTPQEDINVISVASALTDPAPSRYESSSLAIKTLSDHEGFMQTHMRTHNGQKRDYCPLTIQTPYLSVTFLSAFSLPMQSYRMPEEFCGEIEHAAPRTHARRPESI